ncbi:MAG: hypothetical protein Kow0092_26890 [Deferrisomatales bacterium]
MDDIGLVDEGSWFFRAVVRRRVAWGFGAAAALLVLACPTRGSVLLGLGPALLGEALRTWASATLVKNRELATRGPYALVRNPLYLGSFLVGLGVAVMGGRPLLVALFVLGFVPVYGALARKEEKRLLGRFGEAYRRYCRQVPRFVPRLDRWPPPAAPLDLGRMWTVHREWRAWLGLYAATLYLLVRAP